MTSVHAARSLPQRYRCTASPGILQPKVIQEAAPLEPTSVSPGDLRRACWNEARQRLVIHGQLLRSPKARFFEQRSILSARRPIGAASTPLIAVMLQDCGLADARLFHFDPESRFRARSDPPCPHTEMRFTPFMGRVCHMRVLPVSVRIRSCVGSSRHGTTAAAGLPQCPRLTRALVPGEAGRRSSDRPNPGRKTVNGKCKQKTMPL